MTRLFAFCQLHLRTERNEACQRFSTLSVHTDASFLRGQLEEIDLLALAVCFPITDHMMILLRILAFKLLYLMHLSMSSPREGGRGGSGNTREFDCDAYPQGGDFDLTSCI